MTPDTVKRHSIAFFCLGIIVLVIYSNSLDASWHLDDYDNIVRNSRLHLTDLYPKSLKQTFYAAVEGGLYAGKKVFRPIPMLTFGLNWYWGEGNVLGFHLVNIFIHLVSAVFLYLVFVNLLQTPNIRDKCVKAHLFDIALLAAVLWSAHPIQTQAVTYIVQRMASMAGMFFILGIYAYLKLRRCENTLGRCIYCFICVLTCAAAIFSKPNAMTYPLVLFFIEIIFFQDLSRPSVRKKMFVLFAVVVFVCIAAGSMLFLKNGISGLFSGYAIRPFSPVQRLLTEARVIVIYLNQLLVPLADNFCVDNDIVFSTSLWSPWTTLPSILLVCLIACSGVFFLLKAPLVAFAVFFFFLNHVIESTLIPLELMFEHRNYIPSMFIFLPLAAGIIKLVSIYQSRSGKKLMVGILCLGIATLVFTTAMAAYTRNFAWKDEHSLWADAMLKAPGSARAHQNLAYYHYQRRKEYAPAIVLYQKALSLKDDKRHGFVAEVSYDNLRKIYTEQQDFDQAIVYGKKAVAALPESRVAQFNLARTMIQAGKFIEALDIINPLVEERPDVTDLQLAKSQILLKLKRYSEAVTCTLEAIKSNPSHPAALAYWGIVNMAQGQFSRADRFLNKAVYENEQGHDPFLYHLLLIENSLRAEDLTQAKAYAHALSADIPGPRIKRGIALQKQEHYPLVSFDFKKIEALFAADCGQK